MTQLSTGIVNLTWSPISAVDSYSLKLYKNSVFFGDFDTYHNEYTISGVQEGDIFNGYVYGVNGRSVSSEYITLSDFQASVFNFHDLGKQLSFGNISVDGSRVLTNQNNNILECTGNAFNGESFVNFEVISPRNDNIIVAPSEEPFLNSMKYRVVESVNDNVIDYQDTDSFSLFIENDTNSRNCVLQIALEDTYGSGITGNIYLNNEPIELIRLNTKSTEVGSNKQDSFNIVYNTQATGIDYMYYSDATFTNPPVVSGQSATPESFIAEVPNDSNLFLKLTPKDWFGTGHSFFDGNPISYTPVTVTPTILNNTINNVTILDNNEYGIFDVFTSINYNNNSGSYVTLSIDTGNANSFDSNSLFTGKFDDLSTGLSFHYFNHYNTGLITKSSFLNSQTFYVNVELYRSGSNALEDTTVEPYIASMPTFIQSDINFDYVGGNTTLSFDSSPDYSFTGIHVLYSGVYDSDYVQYNSNEFTTGDISAYASVQLVSATNHDDVFDTTFISGSGLLPEIGLSFPFQSADGFISLSIDQIGEAPITEVDIYAKLSAEEITDNEMPSTFYDYLLFEDYQEHFHQLAFEGATVINTLPGLTSTEKYEIGSAEYYSGQHAQFIFAPKNGYGTGILNGPTILAYGMNPFVSNVTDQVTGLQAQVDNLDVAVGESSTIFSKSISLTQDIDNIVVDYTASSFSAAPSIVGTLSSSVAEDPIISAQITGTVTNTGARFAFSDDIASSNYKLHVIAIEET